MVGLTDSRVRNSSDFARFITSQTLLPDEVLVSFDVESLFTSVPVDVAIRVASDRPQLDDTLGDRIALSPDEICSLLSFCLNVTYLAYKGVFYRQIHGTAMGSQVSVTVADLVMEDIEQRVLSTYPNPPPAFGRGT